MPYNQKTKLGLRAVENAIAQQRIEGLEVPLAVVEDMKRAATGEITVEEGINRTFRRFAQTEQTRALADLVAEAQKLDMGY
jgi:hypothetical protein